DVTLVLTHDCNLGCGYCYAGRKFRRAMPRETGFAAVDLAFAQPGAPKKAHVAYFGGEPLLAWDTLVACASHARERAAAAGISLTQSVTTNGVLLTRERVRALAELDVYVGLSIDGNQRAHEANRPTMSGASSWDAVSGALDLLVDEGRPFETISVMTPA